MLTVLDAIQKSTEYLDKKGIDSSRMNAELLLAGILKCSRLGLYLQYQKPLTEDEKILYREYIQRRGKFEPLQYILGVTEFYGMKFKVNSSVLIPRQETEILIDTVLANIDINDQLKILDIGCGSGCIGISLLTHLPNSTLIAFDNSTEAMKVTEKNLEDHKLIERAKIFTINVFEDGWTDDFDRFDLIISNPPYVSRDEYPSLQKEIILFEPQSAVTDFDDGFKFYRRIIELSKILLRKGGKLFFEAGADGAEQIKKIMEMHNFDNIEFQKDYLNINRVVYGEIL